MTDRNYEPNPQHRNGNRYKSQWTITESQEEACFQHSYDQGWGSLADHYWGLHLVDAQAHNLGRSALAAKPPRRELFVGKFVRHTNSHAWHGWPADHMVKGNVDIPPRYVLKSWIQQQVLPRRIIRMLERGQTCTLRK